MRPMEQVEVLRAACCVAGADKETNDSEREVLKRLARKSGVGAASLEAMIERATSDGSFCEEQFRILKTEPTETMAILLEVAMADGDLDDHEIGSLTNMSRRLGVPDDVMAQLLAKSRAILNQRSDG